MMNMKMSEHIIWAIGADRTREFWYKTGEATFNPSLPQMREPHAIEDYIIDGWAPEKPFISPEKKITFIGSCFGTALLDHLKTVDFIESGELDSTFIPISESLSTAFAMRQMFEWQFEGVKPDASLMKGNRAIEINFVDAMWKGTLDRLTETDVFVLMVSSAEIWYDEPSGAVVWRAIPETNPGRQRFRTSTVAENRHNLRKIYDIVRKYRPDAKIIIILSPIPMLATYRRESCITANAVSKAVMRAAIDEVWRDVADEGYLFYYPFYEVVLEGFGANPYGGHFNGDRRHINDPALDYLMRLFEKYYCQVSTLSRPILEAYVEAKTSACDLPPELSRTVDGGDRRGIVNLIAGYRAADDEPMAELVETYAAERIGFRPTPTSTECVVTPLIWQTLPEGASVGPAPQTLATPPIAWAYAARSELIRADVGSELQIHLRMTALAGVAGVFLSRPDGSSIDGQDQTVAQEDGAVTIRLTLYDTDGPAHILLRNCDATGQGGSIRVEQVAVATVPLEPLRLRA